MASMHILPFILFAGLTGSCLFCRGIFRIRFYFGFAFGGSGLTADTEGCETSLFSWLSIARLPLTYWIAPLWFIGWFSVLLASED